MCVCIIDATHTCNHKSAIKYSIIYIVLTSYITPQDPKNDAPFWGCILLVTLTIGTAFE